MASAYSILRNYGDYIQPYDLGLVQQGLQYKQGRYDVNRLKVDQQVEQLANLDLIKGVDKQYLNDRLSELVNQVNQYGTMDLSENGITKNIGNHIKQALDNTVMNAYISSNEIRKTFSTIEDVKKNHPDKYAVQNEYDATEGVNEYLANPEVGASYKSKGYTSFIDVNKEITERLKNVEKFLPNVTKQTTLNGDLYFNKVTKEVISPEKIRSFVRMTLNPSMKNQITIDANYSMRGLDDTATRVMASDVFQTQIDDLNKVVNIGNSRLAGLDKKSDEYKQTKEYIDSINENLSTLRDRKTNINKDDIKTLKYNLYYGDLENNFVSSYSGVLREEYDIEANPMPLRFAEYQHTLDQDKFKNSLEEANLIYKYREAGYDPETGTFDPSKSKDGAMLAYKTTIEAEAKKTEELEKNGSIGKISIPYMHPPIDDVENKFEETVDKSNMDFWKVRDQDIQAALQDKSKEGKEIFFASYGVTMESYNTAMNGSAQDRLNMNGRISAYIKKTVESGYDSKKILYSPTLLNAANSNSKLKAIKDDNVQKAINIVEGEVNSVIDSIVRKDKNIDIKIRNFTIKNKGGKEVIEFAPLSSNLDGSGYISANKLLAQYNNNLNEKIGNTGYTVKDMLQMQIGSQLAGSESTKLNVDDDIFDLYNNYVANKITKQKNNFVKRKDSQNVVSSFLETAWAGLQSMGNAIQLDVLGENTRDRQQLNEANRRWDDGTHTQSVTTINRLKETVSNNVQKNMIDDLLKNSSTQHSIQSKIPIIDKNRKVSTSADVGSFIKDRDGNYTDVRDRVKILVSKWQQDKNLNYDNAAGILPQSSSLIYNNTSNEGKRLEGLIKAQLIQEGLPSNIDNSAMVVSPTEGGVNIKFNVGTGKDATKSEIMLPTSNLPVSMQRDLYDPAYNSTYDARKGGVTINVKSTLARDEDEKLELAKRGYNISSIYGEDDFMNDISRRIPEQYRENFIQKYGGAIDYAMNNGASFRFIPTNGKYIQQWKIGDVTIANQEGKEMYYEDEVNQIYNNSYESIADSYRRIIQNYRGDNSPELDKINKYLEEKHAK